MVFKLRKDSILLRLSAMDGMKMAKGNVNFHKTKVQQQLVTYMVTGESFALNDDLIPIICRLVEASQ